MKPASVPRRNHAAAFAACFSPGFGPGELKGNCAHAHKVAVCKLPRAPQEVAAVLVFEFAELTSFTQGGERTIVKHYQTS